MKATAAPSLLLLLLLPTVAIAADPWGNADAKAGKISITSPIARALIGKKKGASVEVMTPKGAKGYEVLKVDWI